MGAGRQHVYPSEVPGERVLLRAVYSCAFVNVLYVSVVQNGLPRNIAWLRTRKNHYNGTAPVRYQELAHRSSRDITGLATSSAPPSSFHCSPFVSLCSPYIIPLHVISFGYDMHARRGRATLRRRTAGGFPLRRPPAARCFVPCTFDFTIGSPN